MASLPRMLSLRDPSRDTVLYPAVAYPTYEMGALLAGLRAVPVPVDDEWHLDLRRVDPADADRALLLWLNDPSNPTGAVATPATACSTRSSGHGRGASSSPATSATPSSPTTPTARPPTPVTALARGRRRRARRPLAVEALEHGRVAGRVHRRRPRARRLPGRDAQARWADDAGADPGRGGRRAAATTSTSASSRPATRAAARWRCPRSSRAGSCTTVARRPSTCGCATPTGARDGWAIAEELATTGLLVAPGDFYGAAERRPRAGGADRHRRRRLAARCANGRPSSLSRMAESP